MRLASSSPSTAAGAYQAWIKTPVFTDDSQMPRPAGTTSPGSGAWSNARSADMRSPSEVWPRRRRERLAFKSPPPGTSFERLRP